MSGGIRVRDFGLIEVLDDVVLIYGQHNEEWRRIRLKKGGVFNSLTVVGMWHDILPDFGRSDGIYFRRIGPCVPYTEIEKRNRQNKK